MVPLHRRRSHQAIYGKLLRPFCSPSRRETHVAAPAAGTRPRCRTTYLYARFGLYLLGTLCARSREGTGGVNGRGTGISVGGASTAAFGTSTLRTAVRAAFYYNLLQQVSIARNHAGFSFQFADVVGASRGIANATHKALRSFCGAIGTSIASHIGT